MLWAARPIWKQAVLFRAYSFLSKTPQGVFSHTHAICYASKHEHSHSGLWTRKQDPTERCSGHLDPLTGSMEEGKDSWRQRFHRFINLINTSVTPCPPQWGREEGKGVSKGCCESAALRLAAGDLC